MNEKSFTIDSNDEIGYLVDQNLSKIHDKLLMIPGPTNMDKRVQKACAMPIVSHMDPQFFQVMRDVSEGIRYVFQTRNKYSLAISGSATCAMETAICNLLERGQTFLSLVHGLWGQRAALIARKHGYNVIELNVNRLGDVFDIKQIENAIKEHRPQLMYVCHGDSSVGTLQKLDGIGSLCHQNGCLLLVDAVVSLCCSTLQMDRLSIDALFSGAQKALSGPPGVSLLSLSDRAVQTIKNRKTEVDSFYMDINWLGKAWGLDSDNQNQFIYHYTPAMSFIYGLRQSLALVAEEGLQNIIKRHEKYSLFVQKHITSLGLNFLVPKPEHRLPAILSVIVPKNIDANAVIKYINDFFNISISGGLGPTTGKIWRIGLLGVNANYKSVSVMCRALTDAINEQNSGSILKSKI